MSSKSQPSTTVAASENLANPVLSPEDAATLTGEAPVEEVAAPSEDTPVKAAPAPKAPVSIAGYESAARHYLETTARATPAEVSKQWLSTMTPHSLLHMLGFIESLVGANQAANFRQIETATMFKNLRSRVIPAWQQAIDALDAADAESRDDARQALGYALLRVQDSLAAFGSRASRRVSDDVDGRGAAAVMGLLTICRNMARVPYGVHECSDTEYQAAIDAASARLAKARARRDNLERVLPR